MPSPRPLECSFERMKRGAAPTHSVPPGARAPAPAPAAAAEGIGEGGGDDAALPSPPCPPPCPPRMPRGEGAEAAASLASAASRFDFDANDADDAEGSFAPVSPHRAAATPEALSTRLPPSSHSTTSPPRATTNLNSSPPSLVGSSPVQMSPSDHSRAPRDSAGFQFPRAGPEPTARTDSPKRTFLWTESLTEVEEVVLCFCRWKFVFGRKDAERARGE